MADDRWIGVNNALPYCESPGSWPSQSANVLVAIRDEDEVWVETAYVFRGHKYMPNGCWALCSGEELWGTVTHWQPLPSVEGL